MPNLPDTSRLAGEWVARYIERVNPFAKHVDYMMLSHYHPDHGGQARDGVEMTAGRGEDYALTGLAQVGELLTFDTAFDRGYPDYETPVPVVKNKTAENFRRYAAWAMKEKGLSMEKFEPGRLDQIALRHDASYDFHIRNLTANGIFWTGVGEETHNLFPDWKEEVPKENPLSLSLTIQYGAFRYYTGGDLDTASHYEDGTVVPFDKTVTGKANEPLIPTLMFALRKLTSEKALGGFDRFQKKYSGFCVERMGEWLKDDRCAISKIKELDRTENSFLYQKIDFSHGIGATGHSLGGAAAYAHCLFDDEIACGVNMDGGLFGNYAETVNHKPFMQLVGRLNRNFVTRSMFYHDAPVHYLLFKHMMHYGFTDLKLIVKTRLAVGKADPLLALDTLNEAHGAFFDRYLKGEDTQDGRPLPVTTDALEEYKVL